MRTIPFICLFLAMTLISACDSSLASKANLHGKWQGDSDLSWKISREAFMQEGKRGMGHLPGSAEREAAVKADVEQEVSSLTLSLNADATVHAAAEGHSSQGTYEARVLDGRKLMITFSFGETKREYEVEFVNADQIKVTETGAGKPTVVMNRMKS